jgi:hypothetical protein
MTSSELKKRYRYDNVRQLGIFEREDGTTVEFEGGRDRAGELFNRFLQSELTPSAGSLLPTRHTDATAR